MAEPVIACSGLTRYYGSTRGIEDLDLEVAAGEIFGYLGPNGAGKTTTLRLLLDLIRPSRGSARVLGRDSHRESLRIRREVGYLPGEYTLYPGLTGAQLLRYFGALHGGTEPREIETLGQRLGVELSRPLGQLSHGNKQKIGILQALMHRPRLLILDEPTTGLDPLVQQELYALLNEFRGDGGTVLLSSHNLTEVELLCDRVGIVRAGRLIAIEDVAAVKAQSVRKLEITSAQPIPPRALRDIPGVFDLRVDGSRAHCTVRGSMAPILAALATFEVLDLISHEARLDEVFLAMYGEDRMP